MSFCFLGFPFISLASVKVTFFSFWSYFEFGASSFPSLSDSFVVLDCLLDLWDLSEYWTTYLTLINSPEAAVLMICINHGFTSVDRTYQVSLGKLVNLTVWWLPSSWSPCWVVVLLLCRLDRLVLSSLLPNLMASSSSQ